MDDTPDDVEQSTEAEQEEVAESRRGVLQASGAFLGFGAVANHQRHHPSPVQNRQMALSDSSSDAAELRTVQQVSLEMAKKILNAMEQAATEIGVPSVLTVTDAEGNLIAQRRMDNAWLPSVNISRNKAYTAAGFEMPTENLANVTTPGNSLWGLHVTDDNRIIVFGGGIPLEHNGTIVGAVGASGGQVSQDIQVAQAGVNRFNTLVG